MIQDNIFKALQADIAGLKNGDRLLLKKNFQYDIRQEACMHLFGFHASNTATRQENPKGERVVAICLQNKKRVVIDGNGATLQIHGIITPFLFDHCENVTLKNLTVDYTRPTMTEFWVESSENGQSILKMHADSLYEARDGKLFFCGETDENGNRYWVQEPKGENMLSMYMDPKTEYVRFLGKEAGDRFPSIPSIESAEDLGDNRVKVIWKDQNAKLPQGCIIQTRDVRRQQLGGLFQYCKNLKLENVTIRFMNGFGLLCQFCENVTFRGLNCTPSNGRTIACNADFFHFSGCRGHVLVENCVAAGAHDDFVNVHGTHLRIVRVFENKKRIQVRFINPNTWGLRAFCKGDQIDFIKHDTLLPYARNRIIGVEQLNETDFSLDLNKPLPTDIELDRDVIENLTWTPRLTVRKNRFGPSMGRSVLCTTRRRVLIENNLFYKNGGSVLLIADDCNFWMESGYTTNVLFRGNTLIDCGYGCVKKADPLIRVLPEIQKEDRDRPVHKKLRLIQNKICSPNGEKWSHELRSIEKVIEKKNQFMQWKGESSV